MKRLDSETLAAAMDLILSALFVPGNVEPSDDDESIQIAHTIASRAVASTGHGCALRVFQKAGISSGIIARGLRTGVLQAVQVGS
jgi:hypothetical protein